MLSTTNIAFKEWAVVCAALASGRQTIILRKGGIDEGREGFRVNHREFWLLPTRFHQDASQLKPEAKSLWQQVEQTSPPPGKFQVDLYAVVHEVFDLHDLAAVERLAGEHILSAETIAARFSYRRPGLFVLAVRVYRVPRAFEVPGSAYIAGCKSWVELPEALPTEHAVPVIREATFVERIQAISSHLER